MRQCLVSFQPSDEDAVSLNVPMSNIMEEEQIKEDSCRRISPVQGLRMEGGKKVLDLFSIFVHLFGCTCLSCDPGDRPSLFLCCGL